MNVLMDSMISLLPLARSGKVMPVAITSKKRSPLAPDVPTVAESGVGGFSYVSWNGVWAPKQTPADRVNALDAAINIAVAKLAKSGAFANLGIEAVTEISEQFKRHVATDAAQGTELLKSAGIKPEQAATTTSIPCRQQRELPSWPNSFHNLWRQGAAPLREDIMKKTIAATLFVSSCAGAAAQSSVTIGGTMDLGLRQVRNGSVGSVKSEVSGANSTSKLVIRGTEDLGGGLSAGFYLDGTILGDTGAAGASAPAGQFWDRRSTVQLADNRLGEIRLGRDWVPTHLVWSGFDPFVTLGIASANTFRSLSASRVLGQAFGTAPETQAANPTLRVSNAVEYFLPSGLAGVYGALIVTAGEGGTTANGFTRGNGFRLGWAGSGFNVAAAQFTTKNAAGNQSFKDQVIGASYDFGLAKVDVAQRRWVYGAEKTVSTQIGAVIPAGPGVVKLTYLRADQTGATAAQSANDATLIGAGYVYFLSKRTALYGHLARVENKGTAVFAIPGGPAVSATSTAANYFGGQKSTAYEFGLRHDF